MRIPGTVFINPYRAEFSIENKYTYILYMDFLPFLKTGKAVVAEISPGGKQNEDTVETLYSTIYYSKYFIELNFDKSTQYVALWTHKRHPIPRPFGRAMECLLWVLQQKLTVL